MCFIWSCHILSSSCSWIQSSSSLSYFTLVHLICAWIKVRWWFIYNETFGGTANVFITHWHLMKSTCLTINPKPRCQLIIWCMSIGCFEPNHARVKGWVYPQQEPNQPVSILKPYIEHLLGWYELYKWTWNFKEISYGVALEMNQNSIWLNGLLFAVPLLRVAWGYGR